MCVSYMVPERLLSDQVERTRLRPLASGLLTPFQGIQFLGLQLLLLLGILLQLNNYRFVWFICKCLFKFTNTNHSPVTKPHVIKFCKG